MAVHELYSKRQKRANGGFPDVFQYDDIPYGLRVQVVHIVTEVVGSSYASNNNTQVSIAYKNVVESLRREYGVFNLVEISGLKRHLNYYDEIIQFLTDSGTVEHFLDATELLFGYAGRHIRRSGTYLGRSNNERVVDEAISELNLRFKEAGAGYQFVDGQIMRVDSELIHQEAVKPALRLLNTKEYAGAHEEFINAYDHYKAGKNKEALNDCLKAFESTMKAICDKRGWTYQPGDTAKKLIDICFEKGLIPSFWQQQFNSLRSLLESSIPTGRNKVSGHGQGATPQTVPDYLTAYMLHMTASTLVFLTTAEKELP